MFKEIQKVIIIIIGSALLAASLNFFLIPADVFASGFTGVSQLIASLFDLSTGLLLFLLNIPVAILGWMKVGKSFTIYSFVSVAITSFFLKYCLSMPSHRIFFLTQYLEGF